MKIGIVCSPGGHLTEALSLAEAFRGHESFLVVQELPMAQNLKITKISRIYKIKIFLGYGLWLGFTLSLLWAAFRLFWIFLKERPKVLFSTGAEIAVPAFLIGKLFFGAKVVFVESLTRIKNPSLTGKWAYPLSDYFLVQNSSLAEAYGPKAQFHGSLL
jgi:UDP-N-acetylglucosamine:LPS N-acetylglucosamine transferase